MKLVKIPEYYRVKKIRDQMELQYDEEQKWLTTQWIGRALGRLGFKDKRRLGVGVEYKLTPEAVSNLVERLTLSEVSEISEVSEVPTVNNIERKEVTVAYAQTTQITQTSQKEPLLGDLIPNLLEKFRRKDIHDANFWLNWLKNQGCSQKKAEAFFEELKGEIFFFNDEGWAIG